MNAWGGAQRVWMILDRCIYCRVRCAASLSVLSPTLHTTSGLRSPRGRHRCGCCWMRSRPTSTIGSVYIIKRTALSLKHRDLQASHAGGRHAVPCMLPQTHLTFELSPRYCLNLLRHASNITQSCKARRLPVMLMVCHQQFEQFCVPDCTAAGQHSLRHAL